MKMIRTLAIASCVLGLSLPALATEHAIEPTLAEKCTAMMKDKELMRAMMKTMPHDEMMECHRMMQNKGKAATEAATEQAAPEQEHHHGE